MNDDKWQRTVAKRRRQRRLQNILALIGIIFILLVCTSIGGFLYYRHIHSPEYALSQLQTGFEQRDIDTIHQYVDFKTLLPPNYKILTNDIFTNDKIYSEQEHTIYRTFYNIIEPIIVEGTIHEQKPESGRGCLFLE